MVRLPRKRAECSFTEVEDMVIMGSGSVVSQLAQEGLIDEYQLVVCPVEESFNVNSKNCTEKSTVTRAWIAAVREKKALPIWHS